jgi:histidinol-phosphate aminotransferase
MTSRLLEGIMNLSRRRFISGSVAASILPFLPACRPRGPVEVPASTAAGPSGVDFLYGHAPDAVRLNKNENPFGPSPKALQAVREGLDQACRYVNTSQLRAALADLHGVGEENVILGAGSGDVLRTLPIALMRDGGNVVTAREAYSATPRMAERLGAEARWIPLGSDWSYDVQGMLDAVDGETRIFYLVNPNNPTGTTLGADAVRAIADALPPEVLLLIDEAYVHFLPDTSRTGIDLFREGRENVFVTRTFSKAYGLAGLRIGYGVGSASIVEKASGFLTASLNTAGFGGALAALSDHAHVERFVKHAAACRSFYEGELSALGLAVVSGSAPLIMAEVGDGAPKVVDAMEQDGVFVRKGESWNMPRHIRISFGLEEQNRRVIESLARNVG